MPGLRALCERPQSAIGHLVMEFTTPGIGHMLANAGFDFAMLDMEHSGLDLPGLRAAVRYCEAAGLPVMARPPSSDPALVAQVLDAGAEGLMLPMVASAEQAAALAAAARYAPRGRRGLATGVAHDRYRRPEGALSAHLAAIDARTLVIAIIESPEGLEAVEAIAAVPGIDGLMVGHGDLSCALGLADDPRGPAMQRAEDRVLAAARTHGRIAGMVCAGPAQAAEARAKGFGLLLWGSDIGVYQTALAAGLRDVRAALA
jgi:2-dehydro-3-deoxyglucarate aldolase/4-hydroxy-2-oxoheptanedioate aldolase